MPANLPPNYHEIEARYRASKTPADKLSALEEMLRVIPKHKGTDKLQADLKARIAKLKRQPKKKGVARGFSYHIPKEGAGQVALVGPPNSGKSSLLNTLAGRDVFRSDVVGGTTISPAEIPWPGKDQVVLIDTPGLAEVRGESRAADAAAAAKDADLVLFVVDGPLKAYERDLLENLVRMEKRILVCLNKEDWYPPESRDELVDQHFHCLIMTVVVGRTMDQQQISLQLFRKVDRRSISVPLYVRTR